MLPTPYNIRERIKEALYKRYEGILSKETLDKSLSWYEDFILQIQRETIEAVRLEYPEEVDCDGGYITGMSKSGKRLTHNGIIGYNKAVDDLNTNIKSLRLDV